MNFTWDRSPIAGSPISVVMPAYRIGADLALVLEPLLATLESLRRDYEILLVDDGSNDEATAAAVEAAAARSSRVRPLKHDAPRGQGAALRTGIAAAQMPLVFTLPADPGYRPAELTRFLEAIDPVDIVCGYRRQRPFWQAAGQGWRAFLAFGLWLKDPACPVRLYRRSVFDRIPIQSDSDFAHTEILAKANFLGSLFTEIEIIYDPTARRELLAPGPSAAADARRVFFGPRFGAAK
jgi:glycosyltransferase involved in cell wall biosynthesis